MNGAYYISRAIAQEVVYMGEIMELKELGSNSALPFINEMTLAKVTSLSFHFLICSLSLDWHED